MPRVLLPISLLVLGCTAACTEVSGTGGGELPITAIAVDPAQFLGDVSCTTATGGLRFYVATLTDVTPAPKGAPKVDAFVLPSSSPTACYLPVHFHLVVPEHEYLADIQGYDQPIEDVTPLALGSPLLVDSTGAVVSPRWTTSCGRPFAADEPVDAGADSGGTATNGGDAGTDGGDAGTDGGDAGIDGGSGGDAGDAALNPAADSGDNAAPAEDELQPTAAVLHKTIVMRHCASLVDLRPSATATAILVDIVPALGSLECGSGSNGVATFDATLRESGETKSAPCGASVVFPDLAASAEYIIDVTAQAGGSRWKTTCFQVARKGVELRAVCDPLVHVTVDAGALKDAGVTDGARSVADAGEAGQPDAPNP